MTLGRLLELYKQSESMNCLDKLYAIFNLASYIANIYLVVDYSKSPLELYFEVGIILCTMQNTAKTSRPF